MGQLESKFKTDLINEIKEIFPDCIVLHTDPTEIQGFPDIIVLYEDRWFALEGKRYSKASRQQNQEYYIELLNEMSFASFIYPENRKEVLDELQRTFLY